MIDLQPAPVPKLDPEWIAAHRTALDGALSDFHRRRRPITWVSLAGGTAAAATVSSMLLVGGSTQSAFAGWSADPTPPAAGQTTAAESECQARLAEVPSATNKGIDTSGLAPELSDVRGPFTITVLGSPTSQDAIMCISWMGNDTLRWLGPGSGPVAAGAIAVDQVSYLAKAGSPYTLVEGRTGDGVTGVVFDLSDGTTVTATSGGGRFLAWWPGAQGITSATVTMATGSATQPLDLAGNTLQPPKSAPGSGASTPDNNVVHNP